MTMTCPDDGTALAEEAPGIHACRRCRGRAVQRHAFGAAHQDVESILRPEHDAGSGAFARRRSCPRCSATMAPLRLGAQPCWLDWCASCGVLWVEKLDTYVVERLERRAVLERGVQEIPADERQAMARDIVAELERDRREVELLETLRLWIAGWWPRAR